MISIRYFHPIGKKLYRTRSKSIESDRNRSTLIVVYKKNVAVPRTLTFEQYSLYSILLGIRVGSSCSATRSSGLGKCFEKMLQSFSGFSKFKFIILANVRALSRLKRGARKELIGATGSTLHMADGCQAGSLVVIPVSHSISQFGQTNM